jgi:hypothetical protein
MKQFYTVNSLGFGDTTNLLNWLIHISNQSSKRSLLFCSNIKYRPGNNWQAVSWCVGISMNEYSLNMLSGQENLSGSYIT